MSWYGKFDVIRYPSFYVVVDMQTHNFASKTTTDKIKAHAMARKLKKTSQSTSEATPLEKEVREIMEEADALGMKRPSPERAEEMALQNLEPRA